MSKEKSANSNSTLEESMNEEEDYLSCRACGATFENQSERNLHILSHPMDHLSEEDIVQRRKLLYEEVRKQREEDEQNTGEVKLAPPEQQMQRKPRKVYKPRSKRVGLTKLRMEDLLRCDACSCIYIDPEDYHKHMRNFHQKYNTVIPRTRRKSPSHQSRAEDAINLPTDVQPLQLRSRRPTVQKEIDTTFITESIIRHSIKRRWSKVVSTRLTTAKCPRTDLLTLPEPSMGEYFDPNVKIKEEPIDPADDNISYLLSQVEVKIEPSDDTAAALLLSQVGIKIEPSDDYGCY